jgi:hypothetical protein
MLPFFIPLIASIVPFILWPIELFLPFPYIIEEIAKMLLILPLLGLNTRSKIKMALIIGLIFAISEGVLYIFNIYLVGNVGTLLERYLLTIPLHAVTSLVILLPTLIDKRLIVVGLVIAIIIHYFFNLLVV